MEAKVRKIAIGSSIALAGLVISAVAFASNEKISLFGTRANDSVYSLVLDKNNRFTSGTTNTVWNANHTSQVTFEYSGASALANSHVQLAANGTLKNTTQITSVSQLTVDFEGSLKARTSYNGATWGGYFYLGDDVTVDLGSMPYFIELVAEQATTINKVTYGYTCVANPDIDDDTPSVTTYSKVMSDEELETEDYLIVYEGDPEDDTVSPLIFDGDLNTLDATHNNIEVEIEDGTIASSTNIDNAVFTINPTSGTILSHSGFYIGNGSNSNSLTSSESELENSISVDEGEATIVSSGGAYLRYNAVSDQDRFRYYKSSTYAAQKPIALYKKSAGSVTPTPADPETYTTKILVSDSKANQYTTESIYASSNGLSVTAYFSDNTNRVLASNEYTYEVKDALGNTINKNTKFSNEGTYYVHVSYDNLVPVIVQITVGEHIVLESISPASSKTTYNTADVFANHLSKLTADVTYTPSKYNGNISYSEFAERGIGVKLLTPGGVEYTQSNAFGTAGTWTVRVYDTYNLSVYGDLSITVEAIPVASISLNESSLTLDEGDHAQLVATIGNDDATDKTYTWSSTDSEVATVNNSGYVTAIKQGTCQIKATANDGGGAVGICNVTVNEKVSGADEGTFTLSSGTLTVGSYVIFSSEDQGDAKLMSNTQNNNNRPAVSYTIENDQIERTSESQFRAFKVEEGTSEGTYAFYDEVLEGYLYAAGGTSNNYLRTESTKSNKSSFAISGSTERTITAQINGRNTMKWNTGASIFSCYSSTASNTTEIYIFEKAGDPVYATSIAIQGSGAVSVGGTTTLSVSFTPNDTTVKNVTWTTSNDLVAGVSGGIVTGIKEGSATITASVAGANGTKVTATKTVNVSNVSVDSVSLNKTSTTINVDGTETLVPTINPDNATYKVVSWLTSDNSVATVDDGTVTGVGAGTATITAYVDENKNNQLDNSEKKATCTVTVNSSGGSVSGEDITISVSDIPSAYSVTSFTADGYSFGCSNINNTSSSGSMQWKNNAGFMYNTTAINGISSIYMATSGGTFTGTVYVGSSSHPTSGTSYSITNGTTVNITGSYSYFTIQVGSVQGGGHCGDITISCGPVTPKDPTSISVTPNSVELSPNGSRTLGVTYTPADANQNKAVTWTSSNTSVATVDTSGKVTVKSTATAGQTATITAKLTNLPSITNTCTVTVVKQSNADHTVLMYICGADLETKNQLATGDIQEILKISGQPSDVNIVIETGGAKTWASTYGISSTSLQRHHISNKKLVTDASLTYASMGAASTLQDFIEYGLSNYPADRTGLILWNHGGGMRGVCYDEKKNDDVLKNSEVRTAVSGALSNCGMSGQKLEWIGYDACLMAVQDIAETNSAYFNYMIASEESEAGYGWDYDNWVDDLYAKKSTTTILKAIVDSFIADNGGASSSSGDQTLSYLNLSYAAAYKTAWENMAAQLNSKVTSSNKSSFNSAITSNVKHYADSDYDYFCTFDAWDFVDKLANNSAFSSFRIDSSYTTAVKNAHANLVAYNLAQKGAGVSKGLCMYWPNSTQYSDVSTYYTTSETNFTTWRNFCVNKGYHS